MDSEPTNSTPTTTPTESPEPTPKPVPNWYAIVSFVLTLIPILLFIYVSVIGHGAENENSAGGAAGWLIIMYYWSIGLPIFICSIVFAIKGLKSQLKPLAIASLVVKFTSPFIIAIVSELIIAILGK